MDAPTTVVTPAPNLNEIKLTIDKSLLEQEQRITKSLGDTLSDQNRTYMTQIVNLTTAVAKVEARQDAQQVQIKSFRGLVATVSSVTAALGGLVGFFISQLVNIGGK